MFVDEVKIELFAGNGGDGCTSFRREKFVPMGGPDGGSGGRGGNIIFEVDKNLKTLLDLKYHKIIKANKGSNGKGKNMHGKNADDIIIKIPPGTILYDENNNKIADLVTDKEKFIVAHGGRGGRGNAAFNNSSHAPKFSELGEPGEHKKIKCELELLADVGLIGMPSVGKSTLLSVISNSKPKIAEYHFTTLSPNLGVVKLKNDSFVVADLPGLIEGASNGVGLGEDFLKHASRTKILLHVIDMAAVEGRDPLNDYEIIRNEVVTFGKGLENKKEIIIANKMDLDTASDNLVKFKEKYPDKEIYPISGVSHMGIDELLYHVNDALKDIHEEITKDEEQEFVYSEEDTKEFTITKDDKYFVIHGEKIEKLFKMTRFSEEESVNRFARILKGMGVEEELFKMGAKYGDEICILDYVFELRP